MADVLTNTARQKWGYIGSQTEPESITPEMVNEAGQKTVDAIEGSMPTITIHSTITGSAGTNAKVENVGTVNDVRLKFTIPQGASGEIGEIITDSTLSGNGIAGFPLSVNRIENSDIDNLF